MTLVSTALRFSVRYLGLLLTATGVVAIAAWYFIDPKRPKLRLIAPIGVICAGFAVLVLLFFSSNPRIRPAIAVSEVPSVSSAPQSQDDLAQPASAFDEMVAADLAFERGDNDAAMRIWLPLAELGNAKAQFNVGSQYAAGRGVDKNYKTAMKWFRSAADQNHAGAQLVTGVFLANGHGADKDLKQAELLILKSAAQGNAKAIEYIGIFAMRYVEGDGVPIDYEKALSMLHHAADRGSVNAQLNLGLMYGTGKGVNIDHSKATALFRQAASQGNATGQFDMGLSYEEGLGVGKDPAQAVAWYRKAADQGHPRAQVNLGRMYANGDGVAKDLSQAKFWYQKSADQGNEDAKALLNSFATTTGQDAPADAAAVMGSVGGKSTPIPPSFSEYLSPPYYVGVRAPVKLVSEFDKSFRTRLLATATQEPNFAGEYVLTTWGCGALCIMGAAVNARTGEVIALPGSICCWKGDGEKLIFRKDSRLLVLAGLINEEGVHGAHFYAMDGDTFVPVSTIPVADVN